MSIGLYYAKEQFFMWFKYNAANRKSSKNLQREKYKIIKRAKLVNSVFLHQIKKIMELSFLKQIVRIICKF